jgi:hypothetical protein
MYPRNLFYSRDNTVIQEVPSEKPKPIHREEPWGFWRALLMRKDQKTARIGVIASIILMPAVGALWYQHLRDVAATLKRAEAAEARLERVTTKFDATTERVAVLMERTNITLDKVVKGQQAVVDLAVSKVTGSTVPSKSKEPPVVGPISKPPPSPTPMKIP